MHDRSGDESGDGDGSSSTADAHSPHDALAVAGSTETDAGSASSEPNYVSTAVPTDAPPAEYSYTQRRADLYRQILDIGHPDHINQTEIAEYYDVDQSTISRDIDAIAAHVRETRVANLDRRSLDVQAAVSRAIRELQDAGEFEDAAELAIEFDQWCWDANDRLEIAELLAEVDR